MSAGAGTAYGTEADPVYVVVVAPEEANPADSGHNEGCLVISVVEEVAGEERQRSEVGRVGYKRRTSKWKSKPFHQAVREARDLAEATAVALNEAVTRRAAAREAALTRREAAVREARQRVERELEALNAKMDDLTDQMDKLGERDDEAAAEAREAEATDPAVLEADREVEALQADLKQQEAVAG